MSSENQFAHRAAANEEVCPEENTLLWNFPRRRGEKPSRMRCLCVLNSMRWNFDRFPSNSNREFVKIKVYCIQVGIGKDGQLLRKAWTLSA